MMPYSAWLKLRFVQSFLAKTKNWTWEDLVALAVQSHGRSELSRQEVIQLCGLLKQANLSKPPAACYPASFVKSPCAPGDLVWKTNREKQVQATHYQAGSKGLQLVFASVEDQLSWVGSWLDSDPRASWAELLARQQARWRYSEPAPTDWPVSDVAAKRLRRTQTRAAAEQLPLPDNSTLDKRYWGLEVGNRLRHASKPPLVVTQVRLNVGQPPTLTLEESA